jgi:hypothetical protein
MHSHQASLAAPELDKAVGFKRTLTTSAAGRVVYSTSPDESVAPFIPFLNSFFFHLSGPIVKLFSGSSRSATPKCSQPFTEALLLSIQNLGRVISRPKFETNTLEFGA